jgi:hypothetical protein
MSLLFCREHPAVYSRSVPFTKRCARAVYKEEHECVLIEGVPVQFLPAYKSLIEDALTQAHEIDYEGVPTRVVRAEHIVAICLQTGRDKDRQRVRLLREQGELDPGYLADVLRRHNLEEKWKNWTE